jgi:hypothetical protein
MTQYIVEGEDVADSYSAWKKPVNFGDWKMGHSPKT